MARIKGLPVWFGAAFVVASTVAWPASETLVELARRTRPNPVLIERMRELVPAQFEPMVSKADLIVYGTVKRLNTYLSEDQRQLFTDYVVTPVRVMFQKTAPRANTPGTAQPIVFTVWGGRTSIEGVEVILRDKNAPSFDTASQFVLYLIENETRRGTFRLAEDVTGVVGVAGGRIQLLSKDDAYGSTFRRLEGSTVDQLDVEIRRLKQK